MNMKKFVSLVLAMVMMMAMMVPAMAATITIEDGTITGAEYAGYKLLNATDGGDGKFAYTVNPTYRTAILAALNLTETTEAPLTDVAVVSAIDDLDDDGIRKFANDVYTAIKALDPDATTTSNEFENVDQGYWLIVETKIGETENGATDTYSLVMLDTAGKDKVTITTKEDVPSVEKKVWDEDTDNWADSSDYDIGDNVKFQLNGVVSDKLADYKAYRFVFHDTLSDGLTFNNDVVVTVGGTVIDPSNYTVKTTDLTDSCSFEVIFADLTKVAGVTAGCTITVEYTAKLNENAEVGNPGNSNTVKLEYSNNPYDEDGSETGTTPEDKVVVFTFELDVTKVDGANKEVTLEGAEFKLSNADKSKWVTVDANGKVTGWADSEAEGSTLVSGADGQIKIIGLDAGTYYLKETKAPEGYNLLLNPIKIVIANTTAVDPANGLEVLTSVTISVDDGAAENGNVDTGIVKTTVINNSGTELPSTGGMGTTMMYIAGGLLVAAAVVLLIAKRRANAAE